MEVRATEIQGVRRLVPRRFGDARGVFSETWSRRKLADVGLDIAFVQDNQSWSRQAGTLRGLHFQAPPHAQGKLVRVVAGAIRDVAVDIRGGSPTYGRWVAETLSAENGAQLWVPRGFLHGFITLEPDTIVAYKADGFYAPECEGAVRFDDPDLAIDWGWDPSEILLSDKDAAAPSFAALDTPFAYEAES